MSQAGLAMSLVLAALQAQILSLVLVATGLVMEGPAVVPAVTREEGQIHSLVHICCCVVHC